MASELLRTPILEVRWCQLLGDARDNKFDPTKAPTWQIEALAPSNSPEAVSCVELLEGKFEELHPGEKKHTHWLPIKADKENPKTRQSCRFKLPEFTYKDGNKSEGPVVYDAQGNHWPTEKLIGNGPDGRFYAGVSSNPEPLIQADAPLGSVLEIGAIGHQYMSELARNIADFGGAALVMMRRSTAGTCVAVSRR
mgnify:CR=1 FL=1